MRSLLGALLFCFWCSPASACSGWFDPLCELGRSLDKGAHDAGHAIEKGAQDTGKAVEKAAGEGILRPVRQFLRADQIPPEGVGAYGIVALKSRPTSANKTKLMMVCESYVAHFDRDELIPDTVPLSDRMTTVWPVDNPEHEKAKSDDCSFVLEHYVLDAANVAMADAEKQKASFPGEGPFLIGWSPAASRGQTDKLVLVVDMSRSNNQAMIDHDFDFWKEKIVHDPSLWRDGFSLEAIRASVKDFADKYGSEIVEHIKMAGL